MSTIAASKDHCEIRKLAFEQALLSLQTQSQTLDTIRQRASIIAATSGLVVSFIGKEALEGATNAQFFAGSNSRIGWFEGAALVFFVLSLIFVWMIIRERTGWVFFVGPKYISDIAFRTPPLDISGTYFVLSDKMRSSYEKNDLMLKSMLKLQTGAMVVVFLQIVSWIIAF